MDHVSANKTLHVSERENISGARVFDGEDQGTSLYILLQLIVECLVTRHWANTLHHDNLNAITFKLSLDYDHILIDFLQIWIGAGNRYRMQQLQQQDWCEQQIKEKQNK